MFIQTLKKKVKLFALALITCYSQLLGRLINIEKFEKWWLSKYLLNWLVKVHANNTILAAIHPIFFNEISKSGDRLQQAHTYVGVGKEYRSALLGFENSLCGKLLVWRNKESRSIKRASNSERNKAQNSRSVTCLTRSWHFFNPVVSALKSDSNLQVRRLDINDFDKFLIEQGIVKHNKSINNRNSALALMSLGTDWENILTDEQKVLAPLLSSKFLAPTDVYFVDWLNQNAIWSLTHLPPGSKIIVRVHSYEIFSYFTPMIDYGRIDELVFISEGIRDIFLELWSWLLPEDLKISVIDNLRSVERFASYSQNSIQDNNRPFQLGMVQYAENVKDLAFALRCLKVLRRQDLRYRIHLAGKPFTGGIHKLDNEISELYNEIGSEVIIEHGYVEEISDFYHNVGIILSTSIREGSHESVIEGAYHGCVPCIRNWPLLAPFNGAALAFPDYGVYETEEDMTAQIFNISQNFSVFSEEARINSDRYFDKNIALTYTQLIKEC